MNVKRLSILGGSGHGKVVGDCAMAASKWNNILFFDDLWPTLDACAEWQIRGNSDAFWSEIKEGGEAFVAIGNVGVRLAWLHRLKANGIPLATVIHPRSVLSPYTEIGEGVVVVAGAVINIGTRLGRGCIVNTAATIDHDCTLNDGVHICPGAHLAGNVHVGASSWVGIGSVVRQGIHIGAGVTVGAGAVVVADVPDGLTVVGVPARPLDKPQRSELKC
jgi:sugar O-acyltransferase (sialic acid O-acetyltransferase NeuD family)